MSDPTPYADAPSPGGVSRRSLLIAAGGAAAVAAVVAPGLAQQKKGPAAPEVALEELMKPGPLPDLVLGKAEAPVTIIEYASMTCGHCAAFHNGVFPKLKEKYIDAGKARLILREFPLDDMAAAASMLARCAGGDKTYPLIAAMFEKQESWAFVQTNKAATLFKFVEAHGFTKEAFDKCVSDEKLLEGISATLERARKSFGVRSTPTFFINGRRLEARSDQIESFERAIEPLLAPPPAPAKK